MTHPLERLLVGRTLATRYRIIEPLGHGGMSVVFRAEDKRLEREVAVKVLFLPGERDDGTARERFRREAGAAARIPPHPNVVQVYDFGTDEETALDFIVMELLRGRDLGAVLRSGRVPAPRALRVLREAARGVAAGHRVGIVHRDVKPGNILLMGRSDGEDVKILDFGIAKVFDAVGGGELTVAEIGPHSPAFASPEQLRGSESITPASDVYQLGLVGYELLTGERPFSGKAAERLGEMESGSLPHRGSWGRVDPELQEILSRALHPDPARRYRNAEELATALSRLGVPGEVDRPDVTEDELDRTAPAPVTGADETALARPPASSPPPAPSAPPDHRRRNILRGAATLVGLLVIGLIVWSAGTGDPGEPPEAGSTLPEEERTVFRVLAVDAAARWGDRVDEVDESTERLAVVRTIEDVHEAWRLGEMGRFAAHYAEAVDSYGESGLVRWALREREEARREEFPEATVRLSAIEVSFPEEDVAEVELIRDWRNPDPDDAREVRARQEYRLERHQGRWLITMERDAEILREEGVE